MCRVSPSPVASPSPPERSGFKGSLATCLRGVPVFDLNSSVTGSRQPLCEADLCWNIAEAGDRSALGETDDRPPHEQFENSD